MATTVLSFCAVRGRGRRRRSPQCRNECFADHRGTTNNPMADRFHGRDRYSAMDYPVVEASRASVRLQLLSTVAKRAVSRAACGVQVDESDGR